MPENSGQDAAVRKVAEQLFAVWKEEQAREIKENRRWLGNNVAGWVSVAVVVIGTIIAGSSTYSMALEANDRSLRNEIAIAAIKADTSDRLARIETKLDLVIEERE
jgi:hypothetical protein